MHKMIRKIGESAEISINNDIKVWAKHTKNKFIPSAIFKYGHDKVFEVDSIIITDRALIVVEVKSIKGGIEGDATKLQWEKVLGDKRFLIINPIIQNDKHIKHIVKMTNSRIPTISLIVYSNRANYLKINNVPPHALVIKHADIFDTLDEINKLLNPVLTDMDIRKIYANIKSFKAVKKADIKLHKSITNQKGRKKWR
ncbi:MAG: NERD domain-containing protein [Mycoplasmatales bacterium]|nr:NERD domain-containing protein [Mycoplasmatales bacterium]